MAAEGPELETVGEARADQQRLAAQPAHAGLEVQAGGDRDLSRVVAVGTEQARELVGALFIRAGRDADEHGVADDQHVTAVQRSRVLEARQLAVASQRRNDALRLSAARERSR